MTRFFQLRASGVRPPELAPRLESQISGTTGAIIARRPLRYGVFLRVVVASWLGGASIQWLTDRGDVAVTGSIENTDAELVRGVYDELRRFAAVVAPWDLDPDDVLHAVLVSVLQKQRLGSVTRPVAYLQTAIVNHVRSEIRRKQAGRRLVGRLRREHPAVAAPAYPSDLADLMVLQPVERAVLYLHDIEGMTFEEVADAVGISAGNARVIASRARRSLKSLLEDER